MDDREVRAGTQQAKAGEGGFTILTIEIIAIGAVTGGLAQSWGAGIFAAMLAVGALYVAAHRESLAQVVSLALGAVWLILGFQGAAALGADSFAAMAAAVVAGVIGYAGNVLGLQHIRDLARLKG